MFVVIIFYCYSIVTKFTFFFNCITDSIFRLNINDAAINLFSFFWTNFWYIPVFFYTFLLIILLIKKKNYTSFFFFIIFIYEVTDLNSNNFVLCAIESYSINLNFLLTNNLNKYHPCIFYFSVIYFITNITTFLFFFKNRLDMWTQENQFFYFFHFSVICFFCNIVALTLGSWWALQEGTWGGWWNWDASETFGLFLSLFMLKLLHNRRMHFFMFFIIIFIKIFIFFYVFLYFFMQLNFDLISHNFGIRFFFFFNNNFFMLEFIIFSLILFLYFNFYIFNFFINSKLLKKKKVKTKKIFLSFICLSIVISVFLLSYEPVLNYFYWNFFSINLNIFFKSTSINRLNILFFIMVWILFSKNLKCRTLFFFVSCFFLPINILFLLSNIKFTFLFILHFIFLCFINFNIQAFNTQLTYLLFKNSFLPISFFFHIWEFEFWSFIDGADFKYGIALLIDKPFWTITQSSFLVYFLNILSIYSFKLTACFNAITTLANFFYMTNFIEINSTSILILFFIIGITLIIIKIHKKLYIYF